MFVLDIKKLNLDKNAISDIWRHLDMHFDNYIAAEIHGYMKFS